MSHFAFCRSRFRFVYLSDVRVCVVVTWASIAFSLLWHVFERKKRRERGSTRKYEKWKWHQRDKKLSEAELPWWLLF